MARILILTLGSRGDVQPYVALGASLRGRGHDVSLSTSRGFDELIARHGITALPQSIDIQAMIDLPEVKGGLTSLKGKWDAFHATKGLMQQQLDETWSITRDLGPDLIIYHPKAFIAAYLARALGMRAIPSFLQPAYVPTHTFPNPLVPLPNLGGIGNKWSGQAMRWLMGVAYRSMLRGWFPRHPAVPSRPVLDVLKGYRPGNGRVPRLHAHSRFLVPKPGDWGMDDHVTGYWFLDPTPWTPPSELADFLAAGPPPVYIGFGSMPSVDTGQTAEAIQSALRRTGTRAIVARGWGMMASVEADAQVHVLDSAPHDWMFPKCAAVVHHGGAGTTHEGLRWGCPTLICPVFGDQPFWGRTVHKSGAGPVPIPLKSLTAERLAPALEALGSGRYCDAAARLGDQMRSETGAEAAADLID